MTISIYTDGGAKGNPGPAAIGIVAYCDGIELFRHREDIGIATNNIAEYTAVLRALELIKQKRPNFKFQITNVKFYSDSELLVNQLNGVYKVKNKPIQELIFSIRAVEMQLSVSVFFTHIPREKNQVADALVNGLSF